MTQICCKQAALKNHLYLIASYIFMSAVILGGGTAIGMVALLFYYMPEVTLLPAGYYSALLATVLLQRAGVIKKV